MKTTKRIAAAAASLALALSMAVTVSTTTAFADDDNVATYNLEVDAAAFEGSNYHLYQIFVGNYDATGNLILDGDLRLGDSFQNDAQKDAFYRNLILDGENKTPAKAVAKLDGMTAEEVLATLSGLELEPVLFGPQLSGYYFMTETKGTAGSPDADSANHLVKLNGDVTVTPKAGKPDVEKKVKEDDRDVQVSSKFGDGLYAEGFNDVADAEIGQDVPFQLVGTIPSNIARFDRYFYEFTDTLEAAKFEDPEFITVQFVKNDETRYEPSVDDYEVSNRDNTGTFTITFNDIKAAYKSVAHEEITPDVKVVVSYTSKLTRNASISKAGNVNEVKLTYSTNTSYDGLGYDNSSPDDQEEKRNDTDDTDEDGVVVFTYGVDVSKIDALSEEQIGTAQFALLNSDGTQVADIDGEGIITEWVDVTDAASVRAHTFSVDESTTCLIKGLDTQRTYKLREITAPDGYEILSEDIPVRLVLNSPNAVNIDGTWIYNTGDGVQHGNSAWDPRGYVDVEGKANLPAKVSANNSTSDVGVAVKNTKHATLPSTGGMGTKLFYIFGGAAVIGSSVILVARKRAKDAE